MVKEEDEPETEDFIEDMSVDNDAAGGHFGSEEEIEEINLNSYLNQDKNDSGFILEEKIVIKGRKPKNPKDPKRESYKDRYFECFFCRQKILSRIAWLKHSCPVKERMCDVPNCGKVFSSHKGYAIHIVRFHGMPKICAHYCPGCKTYYQMNAFDRQTLFKRLLNIYFENGVTGVCEEVLANSTKETCKYSHQSLFFFLKLI